MKEYVAPVWSSYVVCPDGEVTTLDHHQTYRLVGGGEAQPMGPGDQPDVDECLLLWDDQDGWIEERAEDGRQTPLRHRSRIDSGGSVFHLLVVPPGIDTGCLRRLSPESSNTDARSLYGCVDRDLFIDLLRYFSHGMETGFLRIGDDDTHKVWFHHGEIIAARCGDQVGWSGLVGLTRSERISYGWWPDDTPVLGEPIPFRATEVFRRLGSVIGELFDDDDDGEQRREPETRIHRPGSRFTDFSGRHIGPVTLCNRIGHGSSAQVYRGHHAEWQEDVAIKLLLPQGVFNAHEARRRFLREARAATDFRHDHLVPVYELGSTEDGLLFLIMELVAGPTLSMVMEERQRLDPVEALGYIAGLAEALDLIHSRGVLHRDVKPDNILIDEAGRARLCDFGLVKWMEDADTSKLTDTDTMLGTAPYMAPEHVDEDAKLSGAADVYSLATIAYEMLNGRPPFCLGNPVEVLMAHVHQPVPDISEEVDGLPLGCAELITSCLGKDPDSRPTAADMARRCRQILGQLEEDGDSLRRDLRAVTTFQVRVKRGILRHWASIVLAVAVIAFCAAVALVVLSPPG